VSWCTVVATVAGATSPWPACYEPAGTVITGTADRAADRIGRLVYLDAANPINGQSSGLLDHFGELGVQVAGEGDGGVAA